MATETTRRIRARLEERGRGSFFFHDDFYDIAGEQTTRRAVNRLCEAGVLQRCGKGIFHYPAMDTEFGLGEIRATNEMICRAIADHYGLALYETPLSAENLLGLSTQNQFNCAYQTDGRDMKVDTGIARGIRLTHTSDARLRRFRSPVMRQCYIVLSDRGKASMEKDEERALSVALERVSRDDYLHDINIMTPWQRNLLKKL